MAAPKTMTESGHAFDAWWRGLTRQGDPARRPDLVREAFHAGYVIAKAEGPFDNIKGSNNAD
jgi:hypothetical protein